MPERWGQYVIGWLAIVGLSVFVAAAWGQDATPEIKRVAVPKAADQESARKLLLELFRADSDQAKKPEEKAALAEKMLQVGNDTHDDAAGQYMLFQLAKEIAMAVSNAEVALKAVDAQGTYFELDVPDAKLATVAAIEKTLKFNKDRLTLLPILEAFVDELVQANHYEFAKKATALTLDVARKTNDPNVIKQASLKLKDIEIREKLFGEVQAARKVLTTKPDDPAANTTVGRFLCLIEGDWDAGLPLLAKCGDANLKEAAIKELAGPQESAQQMEAADAWWNVAEKESGTLQQMLQQRATAWYELAMPGLSGLGKLKVSGRLEKLAKANAAAPKTAGKPGLKKAAGPMSKVMTNSIGMKLVLIPAGTFVMGSPAEEQGRRDDETQHRVKLTKPFHMGATEVTQKQWAAVMSDTPRSANPNAPVGDNYPINYVTWNHATEFCRRLSAKENKNYRLPTEAEWEYACRAGSAGRFCFGDDDAQITFFGWVRDIYNATPPEMYAKEVGQKKPNAWGLYDMHGNLREFCSDLYDAYSTGEVTDPQGQSGGRRVYRGGSYTSTPTDCRCAKRGYSPSDNSISSSYGFRVVLDSSPVTASNQPKPATPTPGVSVGSKPSTTIGSNQPRSTAPQPPGAQQLRTMTNTIGMKLVEIPAGTFVMGTPEGQSGPFRDETQHRVTLTKPFYLGVTEVTQAQWTALMGTEPWKGQKRNTEGPRYPANYLSLVTATDFCRKLSEKEGKAYRLPTEAEWEYACRAGSTTTFCFGNDEAMFKEYGWSKENSAQGGELHFHPVAQLRPNNWGLYDMHGNL
ncbi:MAG: SUMF1/EgtB/PvdO family nonheme iron enzyme, partial [Planctomycetes bacterium]|nr:SUMF1/EgtB/PvdO family nonheme iron enzyme [Planctomycetota bacterium]